MAMDSNDVETIDDLMEFLESNFMGGQVQSPVLTVDDLPSRVSPMRMAPVDSVKQYVYLNDQILSTDLESKRDITQPYKIHICLFIMSRELPAPFLKYLFVKKGEQSAFPSADIDLSGFAEIGSESDDDDNDDNDDYDDDDARLDAISREFLRQCSLLVNKYVSVRDEEEVIEMYRGFLEDDDRNVYAFFDGTRYLTGRESSYALINEIMSGKLLGQVIAEDNVNIFKANPFVQDVKLVGGEVVPRPISAYVCYETESGGYANRYDTEGSEQVGQSTFLPALVDHETYGRLVLFSLEPITANYDRIHRYALFVGKANRESSEDAEGEVENESEEAAVENESEESEGEGEKSEVEPEEVEVEPEDGEIEPEEVDTEKEPEEVEIETEEGEIESEESEVEESEEGEESEIEPEEDGEEDGVCFTVENINYCGVYAVDTFTEM